MHRVVWHVTLEILCGPFSVRTVTIGSIILRAVGEEACRRALGTRLRTDDKILIDNQVPVDDEKCKT